MAAIALQRDDSQPATSGKIMSMHSLTFNVCWSLHPNGTGITMTTVSTKTTPSSLSRTATA